MRAEIHVIEEIEQQLQKLVAAARAARRAVIAQEPKLKDPKRGQLILAQLDEALRPFLRFSERLRAPADESDVHLHWPSRPISHFPINLKVDRDTA
jgi:hypothetical protein